MPPQPSKNEESIILIEIFLKRIEEIAKIPFVISTIPKIKLSAISVGICKKLRAGCSKKIKLLCFNIETITEKTTINPPIVKIVEIELVILFPITSPRLDKPTLLLEIAFLELLPPK